MTRNRKLTRRNPVAPWELRIGDLRVYYEVREVGASVRILAVGVKDRNLVRIGKETSAVKSVELNKATKSLREYASEAGTEPLVITQGGRAIAVLVPLEDADLETVSLSTNPRFLDLIERSRSRLAEEGGLSSEEVRRQLGIEK